MIKVIALDADDTLWHNEYLYRQARVQYQEMLAGVFPPDWVGQKLDEIEVYNVRHYGYGIKSFILSMIETLVALMPPDGAGGETILENDNDCLKGEYLQKVLQIAHQMLYAEVKLMDQVEDVLAALSDHYRLMLITKGDLLEQGRKVERSGLMAYFQAVEIISDKSAAQYQSLLKLHRIDPGEFLMVGNSLRSDILPVLEIGGWAVYIPYEDTWRYEVVPDQEVTAERYYQIEDLGQLPDLLLQLSAVD